MRGAWEQLTVVVTFDGEDLIIENLPELQVVSGLRLIPSVLPEVPTSGASLNKLSGPLWVQTPAKACRLGTIVISLSSLSAAFPLSLPTTTKAVLSRWLQVMSKWHVDAVTVALGSTRCTSC